MQTHTFCSNNFFAAADLSSYIVTAVTSDIQQHGWIAENPLNYPTPHPQTKGE